MIAGQSLTRAFSLALAFMLVGSSASAATCCVWRVTNAPAPFYLVGTVHSLSSTDYPIPAGYDQALRDSKRLVFEMTPDPQSAFPRKFARAAAYPKGDDIRRHVHPKTWQILVANYDAANAFARKWKFNDYYLEGGIQQLRPWAVAFYLWRVHGYNDVFARWGVENYLYREGRKSGKEMTGLETDDEHIEVLHGMNDIESELILVDAIAQGDKRRDEYNRTRDAWKRGDAAGVWAIHQRFRNLNPGADVRLLDLRNVKWVPKIRAEIQSGKPTSIVVGAAHIMGSNGLIALLQRNGYKFEQL
jgi:uncharacterized protein YbaP (TraB family)